MVFEWSPWDLASIRQAFTILAQRQGCTQTMPVAHVRSVLLQKDTAQLLLFQHVIFMCEQLKGLCQGYDCTTKPVLLLPGKPVHAWFWNGMHFGWLLLADTQTFSPSRSRRLWKPLPTHFLAQHFVAPLQAAFPCLLMCSGELHLGLADTFWSGCSRAAEWSFLARKVSLTQVRGHVRSSRQRDYSPCAAQPRPAAPEPVPCTEHRKELCSYRFVSWPVLSWECFWLWMQVVLVVFRGTVWVTAWL